LKEEVLVNSFGTKQPDIRVVSDYAVGDFMCIQEGALGFRFSWCVDVWNSE
jgi:hypothetical protein